MSAAENEDGQLAVTESTSTYKAADLSPCRRYRYRLVRRWDSALPDVNFVMLNPSTADADVDDATIRRCIGYARSWGHGGLVVTNLFALRATDPCALRRHPDPVGPNNGRFLEAAAEEAGLVVCAWGNHGVLGGRAERVVGFILSGLGVPLHYLALTKAGQPVHPLRQRKDLRPTRWIPASSA